MMDRSSKKIVRGSRLSLYSTNRFPFTNNNAWFLSFVANKQNGWWIVLYRRQNCYRIYHKRVGWSFSTYHHTCDLSSPCWVGLWQFLQVLATAAASVVSNITCERQGSNEVGRVLHTSEYPTSMTGRVNERQIKFLPSPVKVEFGLYPIRAKINELHFPITSLLTE